MISITNLSVAYGEREVVSQITGSVHKGKWLAPIGPNGAGKSTLLRALAGLVPYVGTATINNTDVAAMSRRDIAQVVAFVPQRPEMPPTSLVFDYVMLGRTPHISYFGMEKRHDRDVVRDVLERLSLTPLSDRTLGAISGGESQRVVLARALAQAAPVLILDEPTSALDLGRQQQVLELIDELRVERDLTVVSAMHDLTLAGQFADELWLLQHGHCVATGTPKEVLTKERINTHYEASVMVQFDAHGDVAVVPLRKRPARDASAGS